MDYSSTDEYDEDADHYEDVVYEENIEIDLTQAYSAFTKGIKKNWKKYLDELEENTFCDNSLDKERDSVIEAFSRMRSFMRNGSNIQQPSFDIFDLNNDLLKRIAYLIVQLENKSPKEIKIDNNFDFNNNNNNNRKFNTKTTDESGLTSTTKSDEIYEEDFEVDEEYDNNEYDEYDIESDDEVGKVYDSTYDEATEEIDDATIPYIKRAQESGRFAYHSDKIVKTPNNNRQIASAGRVSPATMKNDIPVERRPHSTGSTPPIVNRSESTPVLNNRKDSSYKLVSNSQAYGDTRSSSAGTKRGSKNKSTSVSWIQNNQFTLGEMIGSGSFGEVYKCMNNIGQLYAVKRLDIIKAAGKQDEADKLLQEIQLMKDFRHQNIVEYIGAKIDESTGLIYIFQEWVPGGSVAQLLKRFGAFKVEIVQEYTRQMVLGLQFLHDRGVIHRDIKGGNVLIDKGTVKLADFGASTTTILGETQETTTIKGTPYFMAPEVLMHNRYGRKGDIWAVGCTIYQMLTGEPPWKDHKITTLVQLHVLLSNWTDGPPHYTCEVTQDLKECLELCFEKDEEKRPKASELLLCNFLNDDEMEESSESITETELNNSKEMNDLKEQMHRVVARISHPNSFGLGIKHEDANNHNCDEDESVDDNGDIEAYYDKELKRKQQLEQQREAARDVNDRDSQSETPRTRPNVNPFARRPNTGENNNNGGIASNNNGGNPNPYRSSHNQFGAPPPVPSDTTPLRKNLNLNPYARANSNSNLQNNEHIPLKQSISPINEASKNNNPNSDKLYMLKKKTSSSSNIPISKRVSNQESNRLKSNDNEETELDTNNQPTNKKSYNTPKSFVSSPTPPRLPPKNSNLSPSPPPSRLPPRTSSQAQSQAQSPLINNQRQQSPKSKLINDNETIWICKSINNGKECNYNNIIGQEAVKDACGGCGHWRNGQVKKVFKDFS